MSTLILIVEDEIDLATTLEYNLEREGYRTRVAHSGDRGIRCAQKSPQPDLILLDLMLPDISGTEVCRQLKSGEATKDIPIIMVTARSEEIDRVVGFEVGADDYVVKPYSVGTASSRTSRPAPVSNGSRRGRNTNAVWLPRRPAAHRVFVNDAEITLTALGLLY